MRFNEQSLFSYDRECFGGASIEDVLSSDPRLGLDGFPISGVSDYVECFSIVREFYQNFPKIVFKELRTNVGVGSIEIDQLWNEPSSLRQEFSRVMNIPAFLKLEEERQKVDKAGTSKIQPLTVFLGVPLLFDEDYWPRTGDELIWRGTVYTITHSRILPTDYFQNTSLPIHVCLDTIIKRVAGSIPHQQDMNSMADVRNTNKPSMAPPADAAPVLTVDDHF